MNIFNKLWHPIIYGSVFSFLVWHYEFSISLLSDTSYLERVELFEEAIHNSYNIIIPMAHFALYVCYDGLVGFIEGLKAKFINYRVKREIRKQHAMNNEFEKYKELSELLRDLNSYVGYGQLLSDHAGQITADPTNKKLIILFNQVNNLNNFKIALESLTLKNSDGLNGPHNLIRRIKKINQFVSSPMGKILENVKNLLNIN